MRSKTVKENYGFGGKICIKKHRDKRHLFIFPQFHTGFNDILLSINRARKLFQAGLQMCDELEKENNE